MHFFHEIEILLLLKKYIYFLTDHDKLSIHGRGKHWDRYDVERLMHKLVLEGYLREELVTSTLDIINAFVRVGPEAEKLLRGSIKVIESFY